ncbi:uncharacterized protein RAG0_03578 [Rhynchosporium agropyri]|uniref:2EXR domain-containing protein n=1 Tax=Rhynchosporium agropyri TaxID=914238 RepID=A0A1E1K9A3_9HELO|nr:uncharacterized protein RAG0_03578 [Rhynchosporium agropyri]
MVVDEDLSDAALQEYHEATISVLFIASVKPRFNSPDSSSLKWTGPGKPLKKFTLFPKLPNEIRHMIWLYALPSERVITFCTREKSFVDGKVKIWPPGNTGRLRASGITRRKTERTLYKRQHRARKLQGSVTSDPSDSEDLDYVYRSDYMDFSEDSEGCTPHVANHDPQTHSIRFAEVNRHSEERINTAKLQYRKALASFMDPASASPGNLRYSAINIAATSTTRGSATSQMGRGGSPDNKSASTQHSASIPQRLELRDNNTIRTSPAKSVKAKYYPTLLQVCADSRAVALKHFTLSLHKERDGKPIYIDCRCEEVRLLDVKTLLVLGGLQSFRDRNKRAVSEVLGQRRNELENKLRVLSLAFTWVGSSCRPIVPLLARFRNLDVVLMDGLRRGNGHFNQAGETTQEKKLKGLLDQDDKDRGVGCLLNKVPDFKYVR